MATENKQEKHDVHFRVDDKMNEFLTRLAKSEGLTRNMFVKRIVSIEVHKLRKRMEDMQ